MFQTFGDWTYTFVNMGWPLLLSPVHTVWAFVHLCLKLLLQILWEPGRIGQTLSLTLLCLIWLLWPRPGTWGRWTDLLFFLYLLLLLPWPGTNGEQCCFLQQPVLNWCWHCPEMLVTREALLTGDCHRVTPWPKLLCGWSVWKFLWLFFS